MKKLLYHIDFYSVQPQLYISKQKKLPSLIGSIFSSISILLLVTFGFYLFLKVLNKTSMTIIFNQENTRPKNFDHSEVPFIFSIRDFNGDPVANLDKIVKLHSAYTRYFVEKDHLQAEDRAFDLEKCDKNLVVKNLSQEFEIPNIKDSFCIPNDNKNFTLYGVGGDNAGFSMLNMYIFKCKNSTENNNNNNKCLSAEKIDETLSNSIITFIFPDFDVNHNLIENPFQRKLFSDTWSLSPKMTVEMILSKKEVEYITDHGLIFAEEVKHSGFKHDSLVMKYDLLNESKETRNYFLNIMIILSGKKEVFNRKFLKLEEAIASLGGIIKIVQTFSQLMLLFFTDQLYFQDLINKIFLFDEKLIQKSRREIAELRENVRKDFMNPLNSNTDYDMKV